MRILVLYVDRDGDLKLQGFQTPVVGRDDVLRLGIRYILSNPDDSDANAIFAAVKIFDRLVQEYGADSVSIAVVSGSPDPAVANLVVLKELDQVLAVFDADAIYFVSDGPSDEIAVSAVQTKRPVISVNRVVVKQARGVEETVTLLRYYLNKAFREPEYRRYTVGVPSALLFILLIASIFNIEAIKIILNMSLLFIVFFFMLYGFGIYDFLRSLLKKFEITFIITLVVLFLLFTYLTSLALGSPLFQGYEYIITVALTFPFISYTVESYIASRKVKYGGIMAGGVTISFFYFLFPRLINVQRDIIDILFGLLLFVISIFIIYIIIYFIRLFRK